MWVNISLLSFCVLLLHGVLMLVSNFELFRSAMRWIVATGENGPAKAQRQSIRRSCKTPNTIRRQRSKHELVANLIFSAVVLAVYVFPSLCSDMMYPITVWMEVTPTTIFQMTLLFALSGTILIQEWTEFGAQLFDILMSASTDRNNRGDEHDVTLRTRLAVLWARLARSVIWEEVISLTSLRLSLSIAMVVKAAWLFFGGLRDQLDSLRISRAYDVLRYEIKHPDKCFFEDSESAEWDRLVQTGSFKTTHNMIASCTIISWLLLAGRIVVLYRGRETTGRNGVPRPGQPVLLLMVLAALFTCAWGASSKSIGLVNESPYAVLGISEDSDWKAIRRAYMIELRKNGWYD
ncbi:expressed unknown protein [Seminavis robusta]|uniref:Uncharacterized protein n=1 Tax=Seminavis robusta TaxID=568900 RepID=A0A9N8HUB7_9STRA|nr:expressed unknown protein [Seminavis robusta]|eukprot:Sro2033_g311940.1 n/a (349) ;mRNA; f:9406-10694